MNEGATIQFKPVHTGDLLSAREDAKHGVVGFEYPQDEPQADEGAGNGMNIETAISLLIAGNPNMKTLCDRVWSLAYMMPLVQGRPENARELGAKLGCSHVAALARLTKQKADLKGFLGEMLQKPYQARQ